MEEKNGTKANIFNILYLDPRCYRCDFLLLPWATNLLVTMLPSSGITNHMGACKKISILGAGAIGLDLAYSLIKAGHQVTLIARGNYDGLTRGFDYEHRSRQGDWIRDRLGRADYNLVKNAAEAGPQDVAFVTTKAHQLVAALKQSAPAFGNRCAIITATNGIPAWFPAFDQNLETVTTGKNAEELAEIKKICDLNRVAGAVIVRAVTSIGSRFNMGVRSHGGSGLCVGPVNAASHELDMASISGLVGDSEYQIRARDNIRCDIWQKLLLNIRLNAAASLSGSTIGETMEDYDLKTIGDCALRSLSSLGRKLNIMPLSSMGDAREFVNGVSYNSKMHSHYPSTAQDILAGRDPEFFPLIGAPILMAREWNRQHSTETTNQIDVRPLEVAAISIIIGWHLNNSGVWQDGIKDVFPDILPKVDALLKQAWGSPLAILERKLVEIIGRRDPISRQPLVNCYFVEGLRVELESAVVGEPSLVANDGLTALEAFARAADNRGVGSRSLPLKRALEPYR